MQYKSALERLSNIHALGVLHGHLAPADTTGSTVIVTRPSDDVVFVDFALGHFNCSSPFGFQSEMSSLHVLFLWHSKGNGQGLLNWPTKHVRKDLRRKQLKL